MPPTLDSPSPWQEGMREPSLTALLACLLVLIFVVTPLVEQGVIGQLAAGVLWALLGVLAVLVVSGHPAAVAVILASTGVGVATAILDRSSALSAVAARGSAALALAVLGGVIASAAFGPGRVTWHRIQGAVALYLIVALLFAHLYGLLTVLVQEAFSNVPIGLNAHAVFYRGRLALLQLGDAHDDGVRGHRAAAPGRPQLCGVGSRHWPAVPGHSAGPTGVLGTGGTAPSWVNRTISQPAIDGFAVGCGLGATGQAAVGL